MAIGVATVEESKRSIAQYSTISPYEAGDYIRVQSLEREKS